MKSQSFEYQLRHAVAPAPDPIAKLRARRLALEEFERVHARGRPVHSQAAEENAAAGATAAPGVTRKGLFAWTSSRPLLGGFATACVVVVGLSVFWLLPPEEREVKLRRTLEETQINTTPPAETRAESSEVATPTDVATPIETPRVETPREATRPVESRASSAAPPGQAALKDSPSQAPAATPSSSESQQATAEPPAAPAPVPAPVAQENKEVEYEDITITGSRIQPRTLESPSAIVSIGGSTAQSNASSDSSQELQESVVTGSRLSGRRNRGRGPRDVSAESSNSTSWLSRSEKKAERQPAGQSVEGGDRFKHFEANPVKRVATDPVSTFSVDVDTSSYSYIRRWFAQNKLPPADSVRVEEMINYFDYAWPTPDSREQPFKPTVTVSDSPWGEGKKLIHIGIRGYALPLEQQPDVNLVLLLDVSGSMNSPDKLPLAKQSMALLLDSLKPTDTVAIVVYAGAAGTVLAPTPVREKETILEALSSLEPGGSTAGAEGIQLAYELAAKNFRKNGVNRILLATDGDFNVGISDEGELKRFVQREREKGVFLSVLGFGMGNYQDETAQVLAQNGNGAAAYIDSLKEAKKVLVQQSTGALFTIAKDVKLQVEFNPATVSEYRLVGYETRSLNTEDFNNDRVDAGDVGAGHTVTAIYEITPVGSGAELISERRYAAGRDEGKASTARGDGDGGSGDNGGGGDGSRTGNGSSSDGGRTSKGGGSGSSRTANASGKANEYGYLKIRYKLPNGFRSRLIEQPILVDTVVPASLRKDVEFSTAVAGFGQLLRGGTYTGPLSYNDVLREAENSLGEDAHGYRKEFLELVRRAGQIKKD